MRRRRFVQLSATGVVAGLAGCGGVLNSGPDPSVEDVSTESKLLGETNFDVLVNNGGAEGEVVVTVALYNASDEELKSKSKTSTIPKGETQQVTVSMDVPSSAEYYEATVEAV